METSIAQNVGVDICKATLDVHLHPAGNARQFANTAKGIAALIGSLCGHEIARIVLEPTGPYHHGFERRLGDHGLPLAKVNPRRARRFAEAIGRHAKTDAVDAAMLARMGALLEPPSRPIATEALDAMKELHVAGQALVKDRTAARNRDHVCRSKLLKRHAAQRLAQIDRQIAAIDTELKASPQCEPDLKARFDVLVSIPGIGDITAIAMLIDMPELGTLDNKQVASLAGLAPIARDSGQHRGKRHIRDRTRPAATGPLHAGPRRHALRPGPESQIQGARRLGSARQSDHHRRHAKAHHPRKRAAQKRRALDPDARLITTDTLERDDARVNRQGIHNPVDF